MIEGPVQMLVLGCDRSGGAARLTAELGRLRDSDAVRVVDAVTVSKSEVGEVEVKRLVGPWSEAVPGGGSLVAAVAGIPPRSSGLAAGGAGEGELWDVLTDLPAGIAAVVALVEHRWAIPLRDAIRRPGAVSPAVTPPPAPGAGRQHTTAAAPRSRRS